MPVITYTKTGAKASTQAKLDSSIFEVEIKDHELLKEAYVAYQANGRDNLAKTKTRGEVSGGGKKPWRQKGTGRARFGSSRVPIWRGGGITFGPTGNENYSKSINKKAKRLAIRQALSIAAKDNKIIAIEELIAKKTSELTGLLKKINANGRTLIVISNKTDLIERSSRNLANVKLVVANYLNVFDVLNADSIVIDKASLEIISGWLGGEK